MLSVSNHCASECTHAPVIFEGCVHGHSDIFVIYKLPRAIRSNGETCAPPTLRVLEGVTMANSRTIQPILFHCVGLYNFTST